MSIHPTAIIADGAEIAPDATVGPYCIVDAHSVIGPGARLEAHVVVAGRTVIGPRTRVWPFASLGSDPQDLKYAGETSRLEIGADCMIREHVTANPGTTGGGMVTRIGNGCLLMVGTHIGHDCQLGNGVIMANNATLAGHVRIGDNAVLGGLSAVHQWVRIGRGAMIGGVTGVEKDVIPFGSALGDRAVLGGLNLVGLKRHGFARDDIHALRTAYRAIFLDGEGPLADRARRVAGGAGPLVRELTDFILADTSRHFCTPRAD